MVGAGGAGGATEPNVGGCSNTEVYPQREKKENVHILHEERLAAIMVKSVGDVRLLACCRPRHTHAV